MGCRRTGSTRRRSSLQAGGLTPLTFAQQRLWLLAQSGRRQRSLRYPAERAARWRIGQARAAPRARSPHGAPRGAANRLRRRRRSGGSSIVSTRLLIACITSSPTVAVVALNVQPCQSSKAALGPWTWRDPVQRAARRRLSRRRPGDGPFVVGSRAVTRWTVGRARDW